MTIPDELNASKVRKPGVVGETFPNRCHQDGAHSSPSGTDNFSLLSDTFQYRRLLN